MAAEREPIRLVGRVREVSDPAPGSWRISVDGKQLQAWRAGWIVIEVEGRHIRVDLDGTTCGGPVTLKGKGAWSEVQPQIVLATSPHGDPLGLARAIVNHHYITLAGLLAFTAVSAALVVISR